MKKTLEELRKLEVGKLNEELTQGLKHLFKVRFEVKNNQSKNIHEIGKYAGYIGQIKTVLKEKSLEKAA